MILQKNCKQFWCGQSYRVYKGMCENMRPERLGQSQVIRGLECHAKDFGLYRQWKPLKLLAILLKDHSFLGPHKFLFFSLSQKSPSLSFSQITTQKSHPPESLLVSPLSPIRWIRLSFSVLCMGFYSSLYHVSFLLILLSSLYLIVFPTRCSLFRSGTVTSLSQAIYKDNIQNNLTNQNMMLLKAGMYNRKYNHKGNFPTQK